jgi:hypothetical protein
MKRLFIPSNDGQPPEADIVRALAVIARRAGVPFSPKTWVEISTDSEWLEEVIKKAVPGAEELEMAGEPEQLQDDPAVVKWYRKPEEITGDNGHEPKRRGRPPKAATEKPPAPVVKAQLPAQICDVCKQSYIPRRRDQTKHGQACPGAAAAAPGLIVEEAEAPEPPFKYKIISGRFTGKQVRKGKMIKGWLSDGTLTVGDRVIDDLGRGYQVRDYGVGGLGLELVDQPAGQELPAELPSL